MSGYRPTDIKVAHDLLDMLCAEIVRLEQLVLDKLHSEKKLYEVDDVITTWEDPVGIKFTSVTTKIVRGYRAL